MSTPTPSPADVAARAAAPLSDPAFAALFRVEARLAALPDGESLTINGVTCTAVTVEVADLLTRHDRLRSRCRRLSMRATTTADFDQLLDWHVALDACRCQLAKAGRLDLIEVAS